MRTRTAVRGSDKMQPMKAGRTRLVSGVHAVSFRTALALAVGCFCAAVLMVAASSGPVEVWHEPPPSQGSPPSGATPQTVVLEPIEVAEPLPSSQDVTDNDLLAALTVIALALLVISIVYALVVTLRGRLRLPGRRSRSRVSRHVAVLPDIEQPSVVL